jgi:hypothetical protein
MRQQQRNGKIQIDILQQLHVLWRWRRVHDGRIFDDG